MFTEIAKGLFYLAPVSTLLIFIGVLYLIIAIVIECFSLPPSEIQLDNVGQEDSEANEELDII